MGADGKSSYYNTSIDIVNRRNKIVKKKEQWYNKKENVERYLLK